jgi:FAD/FMN-containing dehydrogenase
MTHLSRDDIESFSNGFAGQLLTPGQPEYDTARAVWNGTIDRKPALIATCHTAEQVAEAIRFARARSLELSVRGGGHNYAGHAVCEGGMMIHLGAMNGVVVDPLARRAVCGGGATWADVDAATQQHGLAAPGGFVSHTGIAGLTLGGGIGWLTALAGLSCDNLVSAEVATADSRIVRASATELPDLYWALRGGGGNFGVVTSFEFALHPVGPMIQLGLFFVGLANGPEMLRFARATT